MDAADIRNILKRKEVRKNLMIAYFAYMAIVSIGFILMIPYERAFFLYIVPLSYFGPYIIVLLLYIPCYLIFKAFGKDKITGPVGMLLSSILEVSIIICGGLIYPLGLMCLIYFITGTNVFLLVAVFFLVGYIGYKQELVNRRLSSESSIDSVLAVRKQWLDEYLKWVILALVLIVCLMGIGIYRHKYFTMIDCVVLGIQSAVIIFQTALSPYYNTYYNNYNDKDFVLFLRSFKIDNTRESDIISKIHSGLSGNRIFDKPRILRIGNPSILMYSPELGADTFFLPSEDWQPVVRSYVENAKVIIVLINISNGQTDGTKFTQGVIWELYHNYSLREKFVYCFDKFSEQRSGDYIDVLDDSQKRHPLTQCITQLLDEHKDLDFDNDQCAFIFDGETCRCYENVSTAIKALLSSNGNEVNCMCSFPVTNCSAVPVLGSDVPE